jgi:chemotaxis protein CheD
MTKPASGIADLYVQPGESHLSREPILMHTVLGSCIGVIFWSERMGIGALCHPMLPLCPPHLASMHTLAVGRRFVDFAIRDLALQFDALGVHRNEVQVKLFGGADVLLVSDAASRPTVGKLNAESALKVVEEEGFQIAASSLGGKVGINLTFHTGTGEVLLRRHQLR